MKNTNEIRVVSTIKVNVGKGFLAAFKDTDGKRVLLPVTLFAAGTSPAAPINERVTGLISVDDLKTIGLTFEFYVKEGSHAHKA